MIKYATEAAVQAHDITWYKQAGACNKNDFVLSL